MGNEKLASGLRGRRSLPTLEKFLDMVKLQGEIVGNELKCE